MAIEPTRGLSIRNAQRSLEAYALDSGDWRLLAESLRERGASRIAPFDALKHPAQQPLELTLELNGAPCPDSLLAEH